MKSIIEEDKKLKLAKKMGNDESGDQKSGDNQPSGHKPGSLKSAGSTRGFRSSALYSNFFWHLKPPTPFKFRPNADGSITAAAAEAVKTIITSGTNSSKAKDVKNDESKDTNGESIALHEALRGESGTAGFAVLENGFKKFGYSWSSYLKWRCSHQTGPLFRKGDEVRIRKEFVIHDKTRRPESSRTCDLCHTLQHQGLKALNILCHSAPRPD